MNTSWGWQTAATTSVHAAAPMLPNPLSHANCSSSSFELPVHNGPHHRTHPTESLPALAACRESHASTQPSASIPLPQLRNRQLTCLQKQNTSAPCLHCCPPSQDHVAHACHTPTHLHARARTQTHPDTHTSPCKHTRAANRPNSPPLPAWRLR